MEMYNTPLHYGSYVYPRWGKALGVCIGATCCLQILIWAIVAISKETGTLKEVSITTARSGYTSNCTGAFTAALCFLFSFVAAFPENNSTSELLEGKQHKQQRAGARTHGTRESGGSVHGQSHRHGLHRDDMGSGKPSVTARREKRWANHDVERKRRGFNFKCIPTSEALVARLCVLQGSVDLWLYLCFHVSFDCIVFKLLFTGCRKFVFLKWNWRPEEWMLILQHDGWLSIFIFNCGLGTRFYFSCTMGKKKKNALTLLLPSTTTDGPAEVTSNRQQDRLNGVANSVTLKITWNPF